MRPLFALLAYPDMCMCKILCQKESMYLSIIIISVKKKAARSMKYLLIRIQDAYILSFREYSSGHRSPQGNLAQIELCSKSKHIIQGASEEEVAMDRIANEIKK